MCANAVSPPDTPRRTDDAIVRTLVEHVDLRRRAADLEESAEPPLAALHELGQRLQAHIRMEEELLFTRIEAMLSPAELADLAAKIERAERLGAI